MVKLPPNPFSGTSSAARKFWRNRKFVTVPTFRIVISNSSLGSSLADDETVKVRTTQNSESASLFLGRMLRNKTVLESKKILSLPNHVHPSNETVL